MKRNNYNKRSLLLGYLIVLLINVISLSIRYIVPINFSYINYIIFFISYMLTVIIIQYTIFNTRKYNIALFFIIALAIILRLVYNPLIGFYGKDSWHEFGFINVMENYSKLPSENDIYTHGWFILSKTYPGFYLNMYIWQKVTDFNLYDITTLGIKFLTISIELALLVISLKIIGSKTISLLIVLLYAVFRVHYIAHGIVHRETIGMPLFLTVVFIYIRTFIKQKAKIEDIIIAIILILGVTFTHHFSTFAILLFTLVSLPFFLTKKAEKYTNISFIFLTGILVMVVYWTYNKMTPTYFLTKLINYFLANTVTNQTSENPVESILLFAQNPRLKISLIMEAVYGTIFSILTIKSFIFTLSKKRKGISLTSLDIINIIIFFLIISLSIFGMFFFLFYGGFGQLGSPYTIIQKIQTFLYIFMFISIGFYLKEFLFKNKNSNKYLYALLFIITTGFAFLNFFEVPEAQFNASEYTFKGTAKVEELQSIKWLTSYNKNQYIVSGSWIYNLLSSIPYTKNIIGVETSCTQIKGKTPQIEDKPFLYIFSTDYLRYRCNIDTYINSELWNDSLIYSNEISYIYFHKIE